MTKQEGPVTRRPKTPNKNRTGHKAEHGKDNHAQQHKKETTAADKEINY
jgi:hypothetical protein